MICLTVGYICSMDWYGIETFLKDTVWGIVILGALGGGLLLLVFNIIGRTNKGIQWLKVYYKEGNEEILEKLKNDKEYLQIAIFASLRNYIFSAIVFVLMGTAMILSKVDLEYEFAYKVIVYIILITLVIFMSAGFRYKKLIFKYRMSKIKSKKRKVNSSTI